MKKLWQSCLHSLQIKADSFQKREDLYTLDALFICFFVLSCFFIADQLICYPTNSELAGEYMVVFMPVGLILIFLSGLYATRVKVFKLSFEKEQYYRYIVYDLVKAGAYIIFCLIIIESKLLQLPLKQSPTFDYGRWMGFDLELITLPAVMSMQTTQVRTGVIVFQVLYCYLRMESWRNEIVSAVFFFPKIFPVIFCLYKFALFEDRFRKDKAKQAEDRKFASKVLELLPEGVAIVDENGLKYNNNSLKKILRVTNNDYLEALFKLENSEYVDKEGENDLMKRVKSLGMDNNQYYTTKFDPFAGKSMSDNQYDTVKLDPFTGRSPLLKTGPSTNRDRDNGAKSPEISARKTRKSETSKLYKVIVDDKVENKKKSPLALKDMKNQSDNNSRDLETNQILYEPLPPNSPGSLTRQQNDSIMTVGDQSNLLAPWKKNVKQGIEQQSPSSVHKANNQVFTFKEKPQDTMQTLAKETKTTKPTMNSFAEVGTVRLRLKQIMERIHQPYKRSQHRDAGEAIRELLFKLKDQFSGREGSLYSNASLYVKQQQGSATSQKRYMSKSATFNDRPKRKKKTVFETLSRWAMVMNSERESPSGNSQRLEIKFTPVIAEGTPSIIILVRDVTEKEIIRQMEEKERNQSQALAAVSHEFRTPLNGILGMLDTLREHIETGVCQNYLMPAYNSAKLLLTLVNDILDFHQMKEQKLTLVPVKFDLKSKMEDCLSLISIQAKRRGVETKVIIDNNVPTHIYNDPNRTQQVVNNLLGNAIKFTLEGSISIKVELYEENRIMIKVIDTGLGIEAKNIEKLFKTFGKIDSQKNRELNPQGVGLGLTISNSLAEILCSDKKISGLNVVSEFQKGSSFWFVIDDICPRSESCELDDDNEKFLFDNIEELNNKFPYSKKDTQIEHQEMGLLSSARETITDPRMPKLKSALLIKYREISDSDPALKRRVNTEPYLLSNQEALLKELVENFKVKRGTAPRILVADDNDINQLVFQSFLKSFDLIIDPVYNGRQAIDKIIERNIDSDSAPYIIVFLDVEMPIMGGLECARELKKLIDKGGIAKFPMIGQSGHDDDEEVKKCMGAGMTDYLRKPITRSQLLDTVIKWLEKEINNK